MEGRENQEKHGARERTKIQKYDERQSWLSARSEKTKTENVREMQNLSPGTETLSLRIHTRHLHATQ